MISLGIDIGGTQIKAAAFSESGEMLWKETSPTDDVPDCHPPRFALHVRALVEKLERHSGPAESVGISAPGLANASGSAISFMPGRMFGLENFDWPAWLGRDVRVLNDAHAALLGESWQGSARGMRDVVLLTLGTGVGGAILVDGRLVRGHIGRAGHLGHMSLNPYGRPTISGTPGGLEDWIGNHNIVERSDGRFSTTHELIAAFEAGDTFAAEVWMKSIQALACAIASIANVIDPEAVIIGGGVAKAGTALFLPLWEIMDEVEWRPGGARVRILPAKLGEWAGTYGAASTGAAR
jgi:glucokinase